MKKTIDQNELHVHQFFNKIKALSRCMLNIRIIKHNQTQMQTTNKNEKVNKTFSARQRFQTQYLEFIPTNIQILRQISSHYQLYVVYNPKTKEWKIRVCVDLVRQRSKTTLFTKIYICSLFTLNYVPKGKKFIYTFTLLVPDISPAFGDM